MTSTVVQQINLYQDEFRKKTDWLCARTLMQGIVVLAVAMGIHSALSFLSFSNVSRDYAQLQQDQATLARQVELARTQFPPRAKDQRLAEQIASLEADLVTKRRVLDTLGEQSFGNTAGFAAHFSALARQRIDGLWLTRLAIDQGGTQVGIRGATLEPELVPRYLQRLSDEQVFSGTEFKRLLMQRPEQDGGRIDFDLSTTLESRS
jgi:hypothetical protein